MKQAMALKPQEIIAMLLLAERTADVPRLSQRIAEALQKGVKIEPIIIRKTPIGYWCEDAAIFLGLMAGTRLAREERSSLMRVTLSDEGVEFCRKIVLKAYERDSEAVKEAAEKLGLKLDRLGLEPR